MCRSRKGLAPGQPVQFRLDSAATREFTATVETVSPVASPRDRDDPQKFFRVEAEIDQVDPELMRVGSRLRAEVIIGEVAGGIVIPSQVLFGDNEDAYVFVLGMGGPERRSVTMGLRGPDLVEIASGLVPGEKVSLVKPAGES